MKRTLARLSAERAGNIGTLAALSLPLIIFSTAFGVDYGYLTLQQRELQASADLAAIAAAGDMNAAEAAASAHFTANGQVVRVTGQDGRVIAPPETQQGAETSVALVERGRYVADPAIAFEDRFQPALADADAARVTLSRTGGLFFAAFFMPDPPVLTAIGSASRRKVAAFSVGTRLASLNDGILNELLGKMLGTTLSLNVMDYRALADVDISVKPFLNAIATKLDLTAATYEEVLAAGVTMPELLASMRAVEGLSGPVRSALRALEQATSGSRTKIPLSRILNLDPDKGLAVATGGGWTMGLNALQLVSAAAALSNEGRQVALDLGAGLPGVAGVKVQLAIGEPPVETPAHRLGAPGSAVRSAQTRLAIEASVDGLSTLAGIKIKLPIYVEVAASEARLADIRCHGGAPTNASVSVDAVPGVAELAIGTVDPSVLADFSDAVRVKKARIVDATALRIDAIAHVEAKNLSRTRLSFSPTQIADGTPKSVSTRDTLTSATKTLLENLDADVSILFLTLGTPKLVTAALASTLGAVTPQLDTLLYNLLLVAGVRVGEADIRVTGVRCDRPVLVQ